MLPRWALLATASLIAAAPLWAWRSPLVPVDWTPDTTDSAGRFIHDFSYAGYRRGEQPIPETIAGPTINVTDSPYSADPSGSTDSTSAIQSAIDDVGDAGGGVVYLPAGTYLVSPPPGANQALHIGHSGVVLRGAGSDQTRLLNTATIMRFKRIIDVRPNPTQHLIWYTDRGDRHDLTADAPARATEIALASTDGYSVGDWIVLQSTTTSEFLSEHGMLGTWQQDVPGVAFYRRIESIDTSTSTVTIDVPIRYPLKVRDGAHIHRTEPHLEEIGIEDLSIGNLENTTPGMDTDDYQVPGRGGYEVHASTAIYFTLVVNGWLRNVSTYKADGNANAHILSSGLRLDASRFVSVVDCDFRDSQYQGAGGNGYLFSITGSENLLTGCHGEGGRHSYTFNLMYSSGNVIHRSKTKSARLPADFHMLLSMANLVDNMDVEDDYLEAIYRDCCGHGHSTTQSVYWNTHGIKYPWDQIFSQYIIESQQFGVGYVIGTRGPAYKVYAHGGNGTEPVDWVEGVGSGDGLVPQSLYEEQLARRLGTFIPEEEEEPEGAPPDAGPGNTPPSSPDAGIGDAPGPPGNSGGCRLTGTGPQGLSLAIVLALLLRLRRRRCA